MAIGLGLTAGTYAACLCWDLLGKQDDTRLQPLALALAVPTLLTGRLTSLAPPPADTKIDTVLLRYFTNENTVDQSASEKQLEHLNSEEQIEHMASFHAASSECHPSIGSYRSTKSLRGHAAPSQHSEEKARASDTQHREYRNDAPTPSVKAALPSVLQSFRSITSQHTQQDSVTGRSYSLSSSMFIPGFWARRRRTLSFSNDSFNAGRMHTSHSMASPVRPDFRRIASNDEQTGFPSRTMPIEASAPLRSMSDNVHTMQLPSQASNAIKHPFRTIRLPSPAMPSPISKYLPKRPAPSPLQPMSLQPKSEVVVITRSASDDASVRYKGIRERAATSFLHGKSPLSETSTATVRPKHRPPPLNLHMTLSPVDETRSQPQTSRHSAGNAAMSPFCAYAASGSESAPSESAAAHSSSLGLSSLERPDTRESNFTALTMEAKPLRHHPVVIVREAGSNWSNAPQRRPSSFISLGSCYDDQSEEPFFPQAKCQSSSPERTIRVQRDAAQRKQSLLRHLNNHF